jgi:hypothetical protein
MQQIEQPAIAVMETTRTCPRAVVVRLPAAVRGLLARQRFREVRPHPKPIGGLQIFSGHNNAREAHSQLMLRDPDRSMLAGVLRVYMQLIPELYPWDPGGSTHADRRASGVHRSGVSEIKKSLRCEERVIGGFESDLWGELGLRATVPAVLQYPRVLFTPRLWQRLGLEGRRERRPRGFAHGRQERMVFLLISCLIKLIHLLSLNIDDYLTTK